MSADVASFTITRRDGAVHTVLVDAADLERVLAAGPWQIRAAGVRSRLHYAIRTIRVDGKQKTQFLHRFLLDPGDLEIDHRNGDGLDNRRDNLRIATRAENSRNTGVRRDNSSGFKGVSFHKQCRKWTAQIKLDGKLHRLGLHATPELAHAAYCRAAAELHGQFRRTS